MYANTLATILYFCKYVRNQYVWTEALRMMDLVSICLSKGVINIWYVYSYSKRCIHFTWTCLTILIVLSEIQPSLDKVRVDFGDIFRIALQWHKARFMKFLGDLDHNSDSPNHEFKFI